MSTLRKLLISLFIASAFFLFPRESLATITFTISNPVSSLDDEVEVDATISGLISSSCSAGGCYLQAEFRILDESKGFFGYTRNNSGEFVDYFSSPDSIEEIKTKLFNFVPVSGTWSGKLKAKNNPYDSNYTGPGQYTLKFRRFSGNSISSTTSDSNAIQLAFIAIIPTSTPIPTLSPTSTPTDKPEPTNTPVPTATPTSQPPTNTPTPKPTAKPTIKPTPTFSIVLNPTESLGFGTEPPGDLSAEDILGMEASSGGEASSSSNFSGFIKNIPWFPVIAVGIGVLFIGFSLFTFIKGNRKIPPPNL